MASLPKEKSLLSETYCNTRKTLENYVFTWTIENLYFFLQPEEAKRVIRSVKFPPSNTESKCSWKLLMYPYGNKEDISDEIDIALFTDSKFENELEAECYLSLRDAKDSEFEKHTVGITLSSKHNHYTLVHVKRQKLLEKTGKDVLKIQAEITCAVGEVTESSQKKYCDEVQPELGLIEDLSAMFLREKLSDIVITAKGKEFNVHKVMLSARCPVMAAMLEHDTKERQQNRIEIDDVEPDTMQKLLRFMYTSQADYTSTDSAIEVLIAAEKYGLEDLKNLAKEYLAFNINTSNAFDILNVADLYHVPQLKSRALEFVYKNRNGFGYLGKFSACLKNPQLLVEMLMRLAIDPTNENSHE